jgi:hypothetical protein
MNSSRSVSFLVEAVDSAQKTGIKWRGCYPPSSRYEQGTRSCDDQGETFEREEAGAETHSQRLIPEDSPI